ncbi:MAG: hypothetical protein ACE5H1_01865 [Thermodesulfobacteriota bacterium]
MKTSMRINMDAQYENTVFYTARCSCMGHEQSLMLDYDIEQPDTVILLLNTNLDINVWREDGLFRSIWKRIKYASKILFTGSFEWDSDFIFQGEKQIEDYITALREGLALVKKAKTKGPIQKAEIEVVVPSNKGGENGKGK